LRIVEAVLAVNDTASGQCAQGRGRRGRGLRGKISRALAPHLQADTDDMREAPSIPAGDRAARHGRQGAAAHDPVAIEQARRELPDIDIATILTLRAAARTRGGGGAISHPRLERLKRELAQPVSVDLRNIYRPEKWRRSVLPMRVSATSRAAG